MATANQLEEILNSDVDESKILSLVGSLESKLASPTVREHGGSINSTTLNSNHIATNQIVVNSYSTSQPHTNVSSRPVLSLMTNSHNTITSAINVNTFNGGNYVGQQSHLGNINSTIASSGGVSSVVNASPYSQQPAHVKNDAVTISHAIGSTNTGTIQYLTTSTNAVLRNSVSGVTSHSGSVYDLLNQKQVNAQTVNSDNKQYIVSTTVTPSNIITLQNAQLQDKYITTTNNVHSNQNLVQSIPKPDTLRVQPGNIIKTSSLPQPGIKQEVKYVTHNPTQVNLSQAQMIPSQAMSASLSNAVLRTNALTLGTGATVITRTTKPISMPQTVTVLRSPMVHTPGLQPPQNRPQTIQILNVSSNNAPRVSVPGAVAMTQPKTLVPRMLTTTTGMRIAPSQQPINLPMHPPGGQRVPGTNIVLPPNYQLPPGTMLVKNDQGQLMLVTQQQAHQLKVQTRPQGPPGLVSQTQQLVSSSPTLVAAVAPGSLVSAPNALSHIRPQVTMARTQVIGQAPNVVPTGIMTSGQASAANQGILESVKKCKNFLSTLLKLASQSNQPPQTIRNVKELIQGLVDGLVQPEDFTAKLQVELKSSPQPYLVPFLKKSLPLLRQSLIMNKMHIEGVKPPPIEMLRDGNTSIATTVINQVQRTISTTVPSITRVQTEVSPQLRTIVKQMRPAQQLPQAVKVATKLPGSNIMVASPGASKLSSTSAGHRDKRKYESLKEDDDINDVATMGGVNLSEESRNILATNSELMAGQLMSCKDENFLNTSSLMCRLNSIAKSHGLDEVPQEIASLISHATEERLRNLIERLSVTSEHRLEIYKSDHNYEITDDVRQQLKFIEELEKHEQKRKDEAEREVLLRVAKSRSKHEDPEQLKLKERAKAMQQAELEEMRQREANMTALAAIGPRKKAKLENFSTSSNMSSSSNSALANSSQKSVCSRQRVKRVNLRDLLYLLENEREMKQSQILFKSFMK